MDINLIRLSSTQGENKKRVKKENDYFLENINLILSDNEYTLKENAENSPVTFIFIETGGTENEFKKKIFKKLPKPYYLISNGKNNSLAAALEIRTFCDNNDSIANIITGSEEQIAFFLEHFIHTHIVFNELAENRLGVIGEPSDWLIASKVDPKEVYDRYHFHIVSIPMEELYKEIDKNEVVKTPRLPELKEKWKNEDVLNRALNIYGAIKRLVKKYKLNGLTIRCFDIVKKYKNTACLALALLNDEGITAGCEGDVPSLITMHILSHLGNVPCFMANPSTIDYKDQSIVFSHCTIPFKMTNEYSLDTHFESGLGIGIKGEMRPGPITIAKICPDLTSLFIDQGEITENLSLNNYCRTQIKVSLDNGFKDLLEVSFGNHLIISYGTYAMQFLTYMELALQIYQDGVLKKIKKRKY